MKLTHTLLASAFALTLLHANNTTTIPEDVIQKGQLATKSLIQTLGQNMKAHMKAGGPLQALDFCSQEAYNLTQKVNDKLPKGVSVKRTTLKERSPLNVATKDEQNTLKELEELQKNKKLPNFLVKQVDQYTYKFYKPLVINKPVCLKCHGNVTNQKLKEELSKRYPHDKAMGYKMGDLRGAVVTTIVKD